MKIAVHLRGGPNLTDIRALSLSKGFEELGHTLEYLSRAEVSTDAELVVQTGFNGTVALGGAIEREVPYLIMEAPPFRTLHDAFEWSSFGYNGLAGGAYRPEPLASVRPSPELQEEKTEGRTLIIGQKPTDHSLRGSDHTEWLVERLRGTPGATLRHHPLMQTGQESIEDALRDTQHVICYTSTASVDAGVAGCKVTVDGPGAWWNPAEDRADQLHRLSWACFSHDEYATREVAEYVLSGYEAAKEHEPEIPRVKLDGRAICEQYYQRLVC